MASIALGFAGSAIGGSIGGTILGVSAATIGGAIGSAVGSVVDGMIQGALAPDQRIEGQRLEGLQVTSAAEGGVVPRVFGRMRVGGTLIWATDFREEVSETSQGGGKGLGGPEVTTVSYRYYASFAVALSEGPITGVGRIWADGKRMDLSGVTWRWYPGSEDQEPDPFIQSVTGADATPAYRGTAYIVFEDLPLERYGNRLPQINVEVFAPLADPDTAEGLVRAVTVIPASGEFVYATESVFEELGEGRTKVLNVHAEPTRADFLESLDRLQAAAPNLESVSLVVAWFGDDLRCGECRVKPGVEVEERATSRAWSAGGVPRSGAHLVSRDAEGRPLYGGTPADFAVVQAIEEIRARGLRVTFYPFILMDVPPGNSLPDPYSDNAAAVGQPVFPWRGRITCSPAPGFAGSPDKSSAAAGQVAAFFGQAAVGDFSAGSGDVIVGYAGDPEDWGLRRMILHYAHLCAAAGGVDAFLIGTEMRGLTHVRSGAASYPAVDEFIALAADVRAVLGPGTKISYAADWSEYFGHQPGDGSGDRIFHLDPLWADANIDFVGIDNYMPLADWRDGFSHADALAHETIYAQPYLQGNIEGGEGYDWYYASPEDRAAQIRTPIVDGLVSRAPPDRAPDHVLAAGDTISLANLPTYDDAVVRVTVTFPSTLADGAIFAGGGPLLGHWIGLRDGGATLRLRAGDGADGGAAGTALLDVDAGPSGRDLAGRTVEILVEIRTLNPDRGEIALWIDGAFVGQAAAAQGHFEYARWTHKTQRAGDVPAEWPVGEPGLPFPGAFVGDLQLWIGARTREVGREDWIFRYKDIRSWWSNAHHDRPGGVRASTPTAWVPESKPIRFTEFGAPALDRSANQPNVFLDPKSSESLLPYFSRGWRDDLMQRAYAEAWMLYWGAPGVNPVSSVYGGPMLERSEMALWTWDGRPHPFFPALEEVWRDGANWRLGHWLTGRLGGCDLAALVRHLCQRGGLGPERVDVSRLHGVVGGWAITALESPRASIAQLARQFGFDATESEGRILFRMRGGWSDASLALDDLAVEGGDGAEAAEPIRLERGQETELPQALKWTVARADESYEPVTVEARRITVQAGRVAAESFPFTVPPEDAERRARRALQEAWVGRETARFRLPPSRLALDPGDVVTLAHDGRDYAFRIREVGDAAAREIEAVRRDRMAYELPPGGPQTGGSQMAASLREAVVFGAPAVAAMDLPRLAEAAPESAVYLAAYADPWPGALAVTRAAEDGGGQVGTVAAPARLGRLTAPLAAGPLGRWDYGNALELEIAGGQLTSVTDTALFAGANAFAVETAPGAWEIVQAAQVALTGPGEYRLTRLLRGQRGTEHAMGDPAPSGARVVALDDAVAAVPVGEAGIGRPVTWLVQPATRAEAPESPAVVTLEVTPSGAGLRPVSPVHVAQPARRGRVPGDLTISWIRRSRALSADSWEAVEVPMLEEAEAYEVDILDAGGAVLRTLRVSEADGIYLSCGGRTVPSVVYTEAAQVADFGAALGPGDTLRVRIAQLSAAVGRGIPADVTLQF